MIEEEIDLLELVGILLKRKWWIIASGLLGGILAVVLTMTMVTPVYQSQTTLMVNGAKSSISDIASGFDLGSLNLSQKLVVTYSEIVKSRIVLESVIERLELDMDYSDLLKKISASPVNSTEILKISVTDTDPLLAADIANEVVYVFIKEVMRILQVNNVEVIDVAIPMYEDINVHVARNGVIGGLLGGMASVGIVFLLAMLDRTLKTADDVKKYLDLPVMASIVDFEMESGQKGAQHV